MSGRGTDALGNLSRLQRVLYAGEGERLRLASHQSRADPLGMEASSGKGARYQPTTARIERLRRDPIGELVTSTLTEDDDPTTGLTEEQQATEALERSDRTLSEPEDTEYRKEQWSLLARTPELLTDGFVSKVSNFIRTGDATRASRFVRLLKPRAGMDGSDDPSPIRVLPDLTEGGWMVLVQALLDRNAEYHQPSSGYPARLRRPKSLYLSHEIILQCTKLIRAMFDSGADMIPTPGLEYEPWHALQSQEAYHRVVELQVALTLGSQMRWPSGPARGNPHYGVRTNHPTEWAHVVQFDALSPDVSMRIDKLMNAYAKDIALWMPLLGTWPTDSPHTEDDLRDVSRALNGPNVYEQHPAKINDWVNVCVRLASMGHKFTTLNSAVSVAIAQYWLGGHADRLPRTWATVLVGDPASMSTDHLEKSQMRLFRLWESGLFGTIDSVRRLAIQDLVLKTITTSQMVTPTTRTSHFCRRGSVMKWDLLDAAVSMVAFKDSYVTLVKVEGQVELGLLNDVLAPNYISLVPSPDYMLERALEALKRPWPARKMVQAVNDLVRRRSTYRFNPEDVSAIGGDLVEEALDRVPVSEWLAMGKLNTGDQEDNYWDWKGASDYDDFAQWILEERMPWPRIREWAQAKLAKIYDPDRERTPEGDEHFASWGTEPRLRDTKHGLEAEIADANKRARPSPEAGASSGQRAGRLWRADGSLLYVGTLNARGQPHGFGVGTSTELGLAGMWVDGKHVR